MHHVDHLLDRVQQGDLQAADELLPLVYDELRKLVVSQMARGDESNATPTPDNVHL